MKRVSLEELKEGMILAKDAENAGGQVLLQAGQRVSADDLVAFAQKEVYAVWCKESDELTAFEKLGDAQRRSVENMLQALFKYNRESRHPLLHYMVAIRREELALEFSNRSPT